MTFFDEDGFDLRRRKLKGSSKGDYWRYVQTRLQPSDEVFRFIAWQLLTPIAFLHAQNVAHRDLKNENFLVFGEETTKTGKTVPIMKVSKSSLAYTAL